MDKYNNNIKKCIMNIRSHDISAWNRTIQHTCIADCDNIKTHLFSTWRSNIRQNVVGLL